MQALSVCSVRMMDGQGHTARVSASCRLGYLLTNPSLGRPARVAGSCRTHAVVETTGSAC